MKTLQIFIRKIPRYSFKRDFVVDSRNITEGIILFKGERNVSVINVRHTAFNSVRTICFITLLVYYAHIELFVFSRNML